MASRNANIDWEGMIGKGENPKGMVGQTSNGSTRGARVAPGWNDQWDYERAQLPAEGLRKGSRTGE